LGDETGTVKCFLWSNEALAVGNTVVVFKAEASVIKEHIEVQLMERGKVDVSRNREIRNVKETLNISDKEWIEQS
jgi:hypothetical protein